MLSDIWRWRKTSLHRNLQLNSNFTHINKEWRHLRLDFYNSVKIQSVFVYMIPVQALQKDNLVLHLFWMFFTPLTKAALSPNLWGESPHVDGVVRWVETLSSKGCLTMYGSVCVIYLCMWWWERKIKQETNWIKKEKLKGVLILGPCVWFCVWSSV